MTHARSGAAASTFAPLRPDTLPRTIPERIVSKIRRVVRDAQRRKIREVALALPPSRPVDETAPFSVHILVCRRDLDMAIVAAKSLNLAADRAMPWVFHDDGSVAGAHTRLLREFPGSRVVLRDETDRRMDEVLKSWPRLREFRQQYVLMLKLLDFPAWTRGDRLFLMDADILFFDRPEVLLRSVEEPGGRNLFNRDIETAYVRSDARLAEIMGRPVLPRVNSGLGAIERADLDFARIDAWVAAIKADGPFHPHRIEQTLYAMLTSAGRSGAAHLPPEYDVQFGKDVRHSPCKHYVGWIRYGFELEGLSYLLGERDFAARWRAFARG